MSKTIGKVASSDLKDSITKDTQNKFLFQNGISAGITSIVSDNGAGLAHTAYLSVEHNLNSILSVGIGFIWYWIWRRFCYNFTWCKTCWCWFR